MYSRTPRGVLDLVTNLQREVNSVPETVSTLDNLGLGEADTDAGVIKQGLDHPPIFLHCPAGPGCTGGLIALDAILDGVQ